MDSSTGIRHRIPVDRGELDAVATFPPRGSRRWVVLVHGDPGGDKDGPADLYKDLSERLVEVGIGSLRFDTRGAGASSGTYREMTIARQAVDLAAARAFVEDRYAPDSIALVGESFGATTVLAGLTGLEPAIVLLWPAIWLLGNVFDDYVTEDSIDRVTNCSGDRQRRWVCDQGARPRPWGITGEGVG